ncbi:MAG: hypothetical protein Q8P41_17950 [Pseudomonadota bacterium]|nr:hypothetical protein [Pseudomonadota bacterium]
MPDTPSPLPPIATWIRWLAEAPAAFDAVPEGFPGGVVRVRAVVADLFALYGAHATPGILAAFEPKDASDRERARLRAVLLACRVLAHPALPGVQVPAVERLLVHELAEWAAVVGANVTSEERREELVRRCLRAAAARPGGEGVADAEDRLKQVDVVERARVLRDAAERERRTRELREAMARAAAEEAAAKMGRE